MRRKAVTEAYSAIDIGGATLPEANCTLEEGDAVSSGTIALSVPSASAFDVLATQTLQHSKERERENITSRAYTSIEVLAQNVRQASDNNLSRCTRAAPRPKLKFDMHRMFCLTLF